MIAREVALKVARLAAEVLANPHTRARLDDGYSRIDPVAIAEDQGIDVMIRPLDKLLGAFLREDRAGILLNQLRPAGMFHMTCAHELGHYFLGHGSNADDQIDYKSGASTIELEADQFAYSLMAPLSLIVRVLKTQHWNWASVRDPATLYQLSLRLGLSYSAMIWSLVRLGKLDAGTAKSLARVTPASLKQSLAPPGTTFDVNRDVWRIGPHDKDLILEPRPDDHIVMELPSHVSAGFLWSVTQAQSEGYSLKPILIDSRTRPATDGSHDIAVGNSTPMNYAFEFPKTAAKAPMKVQFDEVQPWSGVHRTSDEESSGFSLRTQLEAIEKGLGLSTRKRLVDEAKTQ